MMASHHCITHMLVLNNYYQELMSAAVPSVVESHFQQNSKYGQKDGFKICIPKWVANY